MTFRFPLRPPRLGVLASALCAWLPGATAGEPPPSNLAANPGFEDADPASPLPARWNGERAVYARDEAVARSGKASLRYANDDPKRYRLCTQKVPAQPGRKYHFSAWVRTRDVAGKESGATVCLEWSDAAGKWLGGTYVDGVKGTRDWTRVEGIARLPAEAGACTLSCYVRPGMTGTAWFDDVELVPARDPVLRTTLASPVYRGRIGADGPEAVRLKARLNLADYDLKPGDVRLEAELQDAAGAVVRKAPPAALQPDLTAEWVLPAGGLAPGAYAAVARLAGPGGKAIQESRHAVTRVPDGFKPKAAIDGHRRLLLDGKPFFPLGMYWSGIEEADLRLYADSKFNCLMPYGAPAPAQMDLAHRLGLKVIYTVKDLYAGSSHCPKSVRTEADEEAAVRDAVRRFRGHPALLAWYLNDELPQSYLPRLEAHQRWVEEEDPNHPTWAVLFQVREVADYLRTFDVIGSDPYPIGRRPASVAAEWTIETFRQVEAARPMWQVPQAHHWGNYEEADKTKGRTPTRDEKRSMAWQCICEGATGLVFYSWFDVKRNPDVPFETQWQDLKAIAAEIDAAAPALLSTEPVPKVTVQCRSEQPRWLHWLARARGGKLRLFAVNDGDGEGRAAFSIGRPVASVTVPAENRSIPPAGEGFQDDFKRLEVRMYEVE